MYSAKLTIRMWHKVNSYVNYSRFEFRVFILLDWLPCQGREPSVSYYTSYLVERRKDEFIDENEFDKPNSDSGRCVFASYLRFKDLEKDWLGSLTLVEQLIWFKERLWIENVTNTVWKIHDTGMHQFSVISSSTEHGWSNTSLQHYKKNLLSPSFAKLMITMDKHMWCGEEMIPVYIEWTILFKYEDLAGRPVFLARQVNNIPLLIHSCTSCKKKTRFIINYDSIGWLVGFYGISIL